MPLTSLESAFVPGKTVNPSKPIEIACQGGGTGAYAFYVGLASVLTQTEFLKSVGRMYLSSAAGPSMMVSMVKGHESIDGLTDVALKGIPNGNVINFWRAFHRGDYFAIDHLVYDIIAQHDLRPKQFWDHAAEINFLTSHIDQGMFVPAVLSNKDPSLRKQYEENILPLIEACIAIQIVYGKTVEINGKGHMDQGAIIQIPHHYIPLERSQVVILTKPAEHLPKRGDTGERVLFSMYRAQGRADPFILKTVADRYRILRINEEDLQARYAERQREGTEEGMVIIRPNENLPCATCHSRNELQRALDIGKRTAERYILALEQLQAYAAVNTPSAAVREAS